MKERLDVLLVKRNLAASREKAKAVIMAGNVYVDGQKEDKAGDNLQRRMQDRGAGAYPSLCEPGRAEAGEGPEPF